MENSAIKSTVHTRTPHPARSVSVMWHDTSAMPWLLQRVNDSIAVVEMADGKQKVTYRVPKLQGLALSKSVLESSLAQETTPRLLEQEPSVAVPALDRFGDKTTLDNYCLDRIRANESDPASWGELLHAINARQLSSQWALVTDYLDARFGISASLVAEFDEPRGFRTSYFVTRLVNLEQKWNQFWGRSEPGPCIVCCRDMWHMDPITTRVEESMRTQCCGKPICQSCLVKKQWDNPFRPHPNEEECPLMSPYYIATQLRETTVKTS